MSTKKGGFPSAEELAKLKKEFEKPKAISMITDTSKKIREALRGEQAIRDETVKETYKRLCGKNEKKHGDVGRSDIAGYNEGKHRPMPRKTYVYGDLGSQPDVPKRDPSPHHGNNERNP